MSLCPGLLLRVLTTFRLTVPGLSAAFSRNWCLCSHYPKEGNFLKLIFLTVVTTQSGEPKRNPSFSSERLQRDFPSGTAEHTRLCLQLLGNPGSVCLLAMLSDPAGQLWLCSSLKSEITCTVFPFSPWGPSLNISGCFPNSDGHLGVGQQDQCI